MGTVSRQVARPDGSDDVSTIGSRRGSRQMILLMQLFRMIYNRKGAGFCVR